MLPVNQPRNLAELPSNQLISSERARYCCATGTNSRFILPVQIGATTGGLAPGDSATVTFVVDQYDLSIVDFGEPRHRHCASLSLSLSVSLVVSSFFVSSLTLSLNVWKPYADRWAGGPNLSARRVRVELGDRQCGGGSGRGQPATERGRAGGRAVPRAACAQVIAMDHVMGSIQLPYSHCRAPLQCRSASSLPPSRSCSLALSAAAVLFSCHGSAAMS